MNFNESSTNVIGTNIKSTDIRSTNILKEAVDYFASNPGFIRLIKGMIKKYQSLGRWGGSVTLKSLQAEEKEALSTFFRQDYYRKESITISLERFSHALKVTRYGEIPVMNLLESIYGGPIIPHAETLARKEKAKKAYFEELASRFTDEYSRTWLVAINEKHPGTRHVHQAYEKSPEVLSEQMLHVLHALQILNQRSPQEIYRLPFFARLVTKDPHGFDPNTEQGRLLISALKLIARERAKKAKNVKVANEKELFDQENRLLTQTSAEELTELYFSFGILRDDIWNFVTATGITTTLENGQPSGYLEEALHERAILNLPLREVVKFAEVYGGTSRRDEHDNGSRHDRKEIADRQVIGNTLARRSIGKDRKVFIVENSGVFSILLDYLEEFREEDTLKDSPNPPLICTHGQFKLASLLLLDKLAQSGATLYYSGDFDPEGLLMADRLLQRYPNQGLLWHYGLKEYEVSLSDQRISETRLKKLEGVTSLELLPLKEEMIRRGFAGYQEGIIELLLMDLK